MPPGARAIAPAAVRLRKEAARSRRRLYPMTATYGMLSLAALAFAVRSRPKLALVSCLLGVFVWTLVEYLVHRKILHGRFPDGPGILRSLAHRLFDHLHEQHHARPWDGNHINGTIRDTGPILAPLALSSLLWPPHTLTAFLAGLTAAYVLEEWVHHSVHFYHFENRYFRYIRRHHLYHHSPKGGTMAYGLTNGFWDVVYGTRIPADMRRRLHARRVGLRKA